MSIEEKAKAYEEALNRAKAGKPMDEVFPELKESEDERIRKHCIWMLKGCLAMEDGLFDKEKVKADIAWLEKQKEQKPTELPKSEDYGVDGLYAAVDILQKTLGEVDGYQTDAGILEHKCAISAVKELYEQKPAEWSEEDEAFLKVAIAICNRYSHKDIADWLKSLRPRHITYALDAPLCYDNDMNPIYPPINHWKPTEKQIAALEWQIKNTSDGSWQRKESESLLIDIKKL